MKNLALPKLVDYLRANPSSADRRVAADMLETQSVEILRNVKIILDQGNTIAAKNVEINRLRAALIITQCAIEAAEYIEALATIKAALTQEQGES